MLTGRASATMFRATSHHSRTSSPARLLERAAGFISSAAFQPIKTRESCATSFTVTRTRSK